MSRVPANNPRVAGHKSIRQQVLEHMENTKGEFTIHSFPHIDVTTKSISVALRELSGDDKIHRCTKDKVPGAGRIWKYRLGKAPEGCEIDTSRAPLDKDTAHGWRDVAPWMFAPIGLPKGRLHVYKMPVG